MSQNLKEESDSSIFVIQFPAFDLDKILKFPEIYHSLTDAVIRVKFVKFSHFECMYFILILLLQSFMYLDFVCLSAESVYVVDLKPI